MIPVWVLLLTCAGLLIASTCTGILVYKFVVAAKQISEDNRKVVRTLRASNAALSDSIVLLKSLVEFLDTTATEMSKVQPSPSDPESETPEVPRVRRPYNPNNPVQSSRERSRG